MTRRSSPHTEPKPGGRAGSIMPSTLGAVESARGPAIAFSHRYEDGQRISEHHHSRAQLLFPRTGVLVVATRAGRWMVPPQHALWIPAFMRHSVDNIGRVETHSVYVRPDAIAGLPGHLHVSGLSPLLRHLVMEAEQFAKEPGGEREAHIVGAILHEILKMPELPLGLPLPASPRLHALCRQFLAAPGAHLQIDDWAHAAGMSRRSFTRAFREETGLSLSTWRQQACLMAALPRLAAGDSVTSVAMDLDYDSVPAFTTMFSRMLGAPPKSYFKVARR